MENANGTSGFIIYLVFCGCVCEFDCSDNKYYSEFLSTRIIYEKKNEYLII